MTDATKTIGCRALRDPTGATGEARRFVGLERHYSCDGCGRERRSWSRMSSCPDCGELFAVGVIRRAAIKSAA